MKTNRDAEELEIGGQPEDEEDDGTGEFAKERHRIIRFMIVGGEVILERRNKRRR